MKITITFLFMWLCIVNFFDPVIVMLLIEVEPEPEITPSIEDTIYNPRQQGKKTPIDHVDKIQLPIILAYALFRMITMITFLPHR